jgi:hypothetical protein
MNSEYYSLAKNDIQRKILTLSDLARLPRLT